MKKWGIFLCLVIGLGFAIPKILPLIQKKVDIQSLPQTGYQFEEMDIPHEQIYQGNLVLVNSEYPVYQEQTNSDIAHLSKNNHLVMGFGLLDDSIQLSESVTGKFSRMVDAAKKEGVQHFMINSGYRGFEEQETLYKEMGADYALPAGYSEHNLGLALDVGSTQGKMENASEGKWLEKNAWKYGFILRYPKDKTAVTGIQYEPWHIRYVGLPHSAVMYEKNFVMEEYLDYLKSEKNLSVQYKGKKYQISYFPVSENSTIQVPIHQKYSLSGNNMDGVIVTVYPD
ncbi:M15 family metallopeptidase [Lederbergia sp. NSJ-179]|uniref:M15 family metallopeptidase n=1 Tax=Lederbergia sp. NSJ-179 TaxID=2931402 RepID=UPI001FD1D278|nr:M15 family metallopeptidase [Lederbergia sp. NSJ-179]MCJ7843131.1 M15 family metallopeptidase [Lederbergia sp. NSJ-179]